SALISCTCFDHPPSPPAFYRLSLHDALPISVRTLGLARADPGSADARPPSAWRSARRTRGAHRVHAGDRSARPPRGVGHSDQARSEEHTSELQSRENLVCRLLLEKKKE